MFSSQQLGKGLGDSLEAIVEGQAVNLNICGIYQDVTNGGKTAKGHLAWNPDQVLWYVVSLDVSPGVDPAGKAEQLRQLFPLAQVTEMEEYLAQTLGGTIDRLRLGACLAFGAALVVAAGITALFFRLLLAKDAREIAIQRSLGFTPRDIGRQYAARSLLVLAAGVLLGLLATATLGQGLAGAAGALLGASRIRFTVRPWMAWGLCPLCLAAVVAAVTQICSRYTEVSADLRTLTE